MYHCNNFASALWSHRHKLVLYLLICSSCHIPLSQQVPQLFMVLCLLGDLDFLLQRHFMLLAIMLMHVVSHSVLLQDYEEVP